jgi:hypothetical protein
MQLAAPVHEGTPYWTIENGMAIPQFLEVLGVFQGLQRAVNSFVKAKNLDQASAIDVDGRIGPQTLAAVRGAAVVLRAKSPPTTVDALAESAEKWGRVISEAAGVAYDPTPAAASGLPTRSASPSTAITTPRSPRRWLWWSLAIGAVAGIGILAWVMYRKNQGKPAFAFGDGDVIDAEIVDDDEEDSLPMLPGVVDL